MRFVSKHCVAKIYGKSANGNHLQEVHEGLKHNWMKKGLDEFTDESFRF